MEKELTINNIVVCEYSVIEDTKGFRLHYIRRSMFLSRETIVNIIQSIEKKHFYFTQQTTI